jgi:putative SOS response-associated peptidase YedK
MHWGFLMPQVSKKTGKPILPKAVNNTRDDKVRTSPFWRSSFEARRCLVLATSFCEAKGKAPATYYWFGLAGDEDRPPFAFAGIWRRFKGWYRDALVEIDTHSILTTRPNELVRPIHPDRMPVILSPEAHDTWLAGTPDEAFDLIVPFPAERMRIVRVGEGETADEAA